MTQSTTGWADPAYHEEFEEAPQGPGPSSGQPQRAALIFEAVADQRCTHPLEPSRAQPSRASFPARSRGSHEGRVTMVTGSMMAVGSRATGVTTVARAHYHAKLVVVRRPGV
eukprot:CAMPEP_0181290730 /NCGR_PEP_ID=MMETSP1101-20121128/1571_1 /TAXON_ID=46948 /ORGANISM="Rhodomonas abbreviata, Strain Caron Lab Isolate" /LENGTH=111 /DNA_ID=CAMNT_0023395037 /DNA_START=327 /DNA_END=663 /DNA_ORIENTATION=+